MTSTIEQFRYTVDTHISMIFEATGGYENLKKESERWLISKRKTYSGDAYLDQLEKNAVYFVEATASSKRAIAQYFQEGKPQIKRDEIPSYVHYISVEIPKTEINDKLVAFIRGYIAEKPHQLSTTDWYKIRYLKQKAPQKDYIKDLELTCRIYQAATILADMYLVTVLENPQSAGSCSNLSFAEVFGVINQRIDIFANISIGNITAKVDDTPAKTDKRVNQNLGSLKAKKWWQRK